MKRTLLVGLDAACWEYLDPLLERGRLPTLSRLMENGTWGTLQSTMPAHTPTAWASIITGKNPGKHGIFDMLWKRPGAYDFFPVSSKLRVGEPFWQSLNECGFKVGLVNVPFSHPPEPVEGFYVGGFGTPTGASDVTHPKELLDWILDRFGQYEPWVDMGMVQDSSCTELLKAEQKQQKKQVAIATELANRHGVEVLVTNLMLPDHANHYMPEMGQVEDAICETDADLSNLIESFQPQNVMLFSDHGSRRVQGEFLLHLWLRDRGYLAQVERRTTEREAVLNWILMQFLRKHLSPGFKERIFRKILRQVVPVLPTGISRQFWDMVERSVPFAQEHLCLSDCLDYGRTRLFSGSVFSGLLYANLVGREPSGIVAPGKLDQFTDRVAEELSALCHAETGESVVSNVYRPHDLYEGPSVPNAPDLIVDNYESSWNATLSYARGVMAEEPPRERYFAENRHDFGVHSRDGVFVFSGEDFRNGPSSLPAAVIDLPATLLYLNETPIPKDYDGQVMLDTVDSEFRAQHPVRYQKADSGHAKEVFEENLYSAEETQELNERLRALGYLE